MLIYNLNSSLTECFVVGYLQKEHVEKLSLHVLSTKKASPYSCVGATDKTEHITRNYLFH